MVSVLLIFSYEAFITNQMNFFPFLSPIVVSLVVGVT
jgi:hypothetical protein